MKLPSHIVERGMKLAENSCYLGIPLADLSRDELLAVAAEGWNMYSKQLETSMSRMRFVRELNAASRNN